MNSHRLIPVLVICLATLSLSACGSPEPAIENEAAQVPSEPQISPEPIAPSASMEPMEETTAGELQAVDIAANTFTLRDIVGNEETFYFSETTEIIGAEDAQGLSGAQGNQVVVYHTEQDDRRVAVRIEIIPR